MHYKLLGRSGLRVSELCLGTMTFGETWGWGASWEESQKMFDLFAEAGGNFIATSVNYTNGTAEEFLGQLLHSNRDYFVVASKYSLTRPESTHPNSGNSRKNMMRSVETSLRRRKTDYLDLYYLHMWDYMTNAGDDQALAQVLEMLQERHFGHGGHFPSSGEPRFISGFSHGVKIMWSF